MWWGFFSHVFMYKINRQKYYSSSLRGEKKKIGIHLAQSKCVEHNFYYIGSTWYHELHGSIIWVNKGI